MHDRHGISANLLPARDDVARKRGAVIGGRAHRNRLVALVIGVAFLVTACHMPPAPTAGSSGAPEASRSAADPAMADAVRKVIEEVPRLLAPAGGDRPGDQG